MNLVWTKPENVGAETGAISYSGVIVRSRTLAHLRSAALLVAGRLGLEAEEEGTLAVA